MPRITRLVVCGRLLVIATLLPTRAFMRVDFPTLGRPAKQANPDRNGIPSGGCGTLTTRSWGQRGTQVAVRRGMEHDGVRPEVAHGGQVTRVGFVGFTHYGRGFQTGGSARRC